jgi:hypothetical protein
MKDWFDLDSRSPLFCVTDSVNCDFIFVVGSYYGEEQSGMRLAGAGLGGDGHPECLGVDWKDWFERIENCCRTAGWVWANVAGHFPAQMRRSTLHLHGTSEAVSC